ncbi:MAG: molecular chaperone [Betaproteobacteria bacterium]|nr:molecular chaperone [Betaproteobacteria bacterium]MSQ88587.1 molecular chaperone [Betaproteobacteria bacterium]
MSALEGSDPAAVGADLAGLAPEDAARAAFYGLIARLFYAPPDQQLLGQLLHMDVFNEASQVADVRGKKLAQAWAAIVVACRSAFPVVLENEHTELFIGPGKAEVTPYLTHYVIKYATDNPLVELRQQLIRWGIARRETAHEPEDHVAGICETMRFAIAVQHRALDEQKAFFDRFLYRGGVAFCDAVTASSKANFYRLAATFAREFFDLEREAFEMV